MGINLLSKTNMGVCGMLVLVVLLSQSRICDFLITNALGRAILILLILGLSYSHKILGVVAVFFIIIMFNQRNIYYFEGFESKTKNISEKKDTNVSTKPKPKPKTETFVAREGFNMVDKEGTMLRGKRSNTVPVFSNSRNSENADDVEPTNKSIFENAYSSIL